MSVMEWVGGGLAGCEGRYGKVLVENDGWVEVNVALLKLRRVLWVKFESGNNGGVRNSWREKDTGSLTVLDVHTLCS